MSRFGASGTFVYDTGDSITGAATTLIMTQDQMPQYPLETETVTDRVSERSKSGRLYSYENYNLNTYTFTWNLADEGFRNSVKKMYDAKPLISFYTGGVNWGTFRLGDSTWKDSESAFELYDFSIKLEEANGIY